MVRLNKVSDQLYMTYLCLFVPQIPGCKAAKPLFLILKTRINRNNLESDKLTVCDTETCMSFDTHAKMYEERK